MLYQRSFRMPKTCDSLYEVSLPVMVYLPVDHLSISHSTKSELYLTWTLQGHMLLLKQQPKSLAGQMSVAALSSWPAWVLTAQTKWVNHKPLLFGHLDQSTLMFGLGCGHFSIQLLESSSCTACTVSGRWMGCEERMSTHSCQHYLTGIHTDKTNGWDSSRSRDGRPVVSRQHVNAAKSCGWI